MKIKTLQFGELEYSNENVLNFEKGLYGFEELTKFLLLKNEDELFYWLNSIEQPEMVFPLFGIRLIDEEFPQADNSEAFGIVKLSKNQSEVTINMCAPVYINDNEKSGFQKILDDENYSVEYPLFKE